MYYLAEHIIRTFGLKEDPGKLDFDRIWNSKTAEEKLELIKSCISHLQDEEDNIANALKQLWKLEEELKPNKDV